MPTPIAPPAIVDKLKRKSWTNWHENVTRKIDCRLNVYNSNVAISVPDFGLDDWQQTVKAIQGEIAAARDDNVPLRAIGGGWSFSEVPATVGRVLNTKYLNSVFAFADRWLVQNYQGDRDSPFLFQCGAGIFEINKFLETRYKRSLRTVGASNGQTIAGALSTGTHGSAFDFGAIPEAVVGLHIITGPDTHLWLERASYPVATDAFINELGAQAIKDDDLFNAALVSIGSFGVIHGVLVETDPIYYLEQVSDRFPYDDEFKRVVTNFDFANHSRVPQNLGELYHFQGVINPFDVDGGLYMKMLFRKPNYPANHVPDYSVPGGKYPGDDVLGFVGALTDAVRKLTPPLVNVIADEKFRQDPNAPNREGTLGEIFDHTTTRGRALGSALAMHPSDAIKALDILIALQKSDGPAPIAFAMRFVQRSTAMIGFTRFDPCCILDLDGVNSKSAQEFLKAAYDALDDADIRYTQHWGKMNNLTAKRVREMYDANAIDNWITQRQRILDVNMRRVFSNRFLDRLELAD